MVSVGLSFLCFSTLYHICSDRFPTIHGMLIEVQRNFNINLPEYRIGAPDKKGICTTQPSHTAPARAATIIITTATITTITTITTINTIYYYYYYYYYYYSLLTTGLGHWDVRGLGHLLGRDCAGPTSCICRLFITYMCTTIIHISCICIYVYTYVYIYIYT